MCDYEEFLFDCGHSQQRLKSYCHFARNDPNHQCFGVKKLRDVWEQRTLCDACSLKHYQSQQMSWPPATATCSSAHNGSSNSGSAKSKRNRR